MTGVLRRGEGTRRHKGGHVKMEAEISVMWPQVKESLEPPEAGRDKEGLTPEPLNRVQPCQHLDFSLLASRPVRKEIPTALSHQAVVVYYSSHRRVLNCQVLLNLRWVIFCFGHIAQDRKRSNEKGGF